MSDTTTTAFASLSTAELLERRGQQAYLAQMSALEGLETSAAARADDEALDAELRRRGVDPAAP